MILCIKTEVLVKNSKKIMLSLIAWLVVGNMLETGWDQTVAGEAMAYAEASNFSLTDANGNVLKILDSKIFTLLPAPWLVSFNKYSNEYFLSITSAVSAGINERYAEYSLWSGIQKPHMPLTLNMGKNYAIQITKEGTISPGLEVVPATRVSVKN